MIQVRKNTYRGKSGWLLCGKGADGRRVSVFFEHESAARRTAKRYRDDEDFQLGLADFEPVQ